MAIDASIYGQIQAPKFESPLNALAQVTQVRNAQNQNRLFDMKVADSERARADNEAERSAYAIDDPDARARALRTASPKAYREYQTFQATQAKAQREAEKAQLEGAIQKQGIVAQYAGSAKDQPSWTAAKQALAGMGVDVSQVPDQYDPNTAQTLLQRSLTGAQQIEQVWKQKGYDLDVAKFGETVRNNKTQNGIAGANLGLRQQEVGLKREEVRSGGKAPSGYRFTSGSTLEAIPGGPADGKAGGMPKLTEDQGKATGWLVQAENAFGNMQAATKTNPNVAEAGFNDVIERLPFGVGENAANFLRGEDRQKFVQGASSLSEALLRAATGAGVNENEARQKIKELTPVPYDKPGVIKQKMEAIPLYIESLKVRAGPGASLAAGVSAKKPAASKDIHAEADAILRGK